MEITGGTFTVLTQAQQRFGVVLVSAVGRNIVQRATPIEARVGTQPVRHVVTSPAGISGVLERVPQPGDRLYVRYAGEAEIATNVVYEPSSGERPSGPLLS